MLLSVMCSPFLMRIDDLNPNQKSALERLILVVCHSPSKYTNISVDSGMVDMYLITYDQVIADRSITLSREAQENALDQLILTAKAKGIFPLIEIDWHEEPEIEV